MSMIMVSFIECPHCKTVLSVTGYMSMYLYDIKTYTDGRRSRNMLAPYVMPFGQCFRCKKYVWIEKEKNKLYQKYKDFTREDRLKWMNNENAFVINQLESENIKECIKQKLHRSEKEEFILRKWLWWIWNEEKKEIDEKYKENLKRLLFLSKKQKKNIENKIMEAEIQRQLGFFEESIRILSKLSNQKYQMTIQKIIQSAKEKNTECQVVTKAEKQ